MLKEYKPAEYRTVVSRYLVFDDGNGSGYWFPCDENGCLLEGEEQNPEAHKNYRYCLSHPEKFVGFNEIIRDERLVRDNAHGTCICGKDVELYDQYYGACECPGCGKWYNLFGQELLPPECWELDPSEEEYYEEDIW